MPVFERYEVPVPMKMAHFNMPLHVQAPESDYLMEERYHNNRMTSPHELGGPWIEDQSEGGGKFRLKRRRRCGQCGPCQVKENCGKCQYCMRKDILKQACIYRKCVYLRKPVPRFRPEAAQAGSNSSICSGGGGGAGGGGVMGPGGCVSGASGNSGGGSGSSGSKSSPQKPPTPSASSSHQHSAQPAPSPYTPVVPPAVADVTQSSELSSCQLAINPFSLPTNSAVVEPLGGCAVEQQRNMVEPLRGCAVEQQRNMVEPLRGCAVEQQRSVVEPLGGCAVEQQRSIVEPLGGCAVDQQRSIVEPLSGCGVEQQRSIVEPLGGCAVEQQRSIVEPLGGCTVEQQRSVVEPLSGCAVDQQRSGMYDSTTMVDPARNSYPPGAQSLDSGRSPALDLGRNTNTADSGFGTGSSMTTSPASSVTKDRPSMPPMPAMEQYPPPSVEQWGPMPYGFSRPNPWAHPAFQPNAPAAYGFQPSANHYSSPFTSSCRLGMPSPAAHLAPVSQPSFHHNMPFARQDFSPHPGFPAPAAAMQPAMTPSFYPPPPHIPPSLPNFPSFSQLPSSAGPHPSPFPMTHHHHHHPSMYPGNFYPSFRPPTEPQIYHAHLPPPSAPFMQRDRFPPAFPWRMGEDFPFRKRHGHRHRQDDEEDLRKKFSIFRIPSHKRTHCDSDTCIPFSLLCGTKETRGRLSRREGLPVQQSDCVDVTCEKETSSSRMLLKTVPDVGIDDDLQQQMRRISGWGECDVISIDDFKMHAFIRSDGFNNLEIEIDSPVVEEGVPKTQCLPDPSADPWDPAQHVHICAPHRGDVNNNSICAKDGTIGSCRSENASQNDRLEEDSDQNDECDGMKGDPVLENRTGESQEGQEDGSDVPLPSPTVQNLANFTDDSVTEHSPYSACCEGEDEAAGRTLSSEGEVRLVQEGGVTEVEVPASQVQLADVDLDFDLLATSSDPQHLLQFLSQQYPAAPPSPDLVFRFE